MTGLILAYAEIYPNQKTYLYFTSINTDLTQYSAPQYPQEDPNGFDQNGNGGDEPGVNDDGTNKKYEIGKICLSVFVLLFSLFSWIKK